MADLATTDPRAAAWERRLLAPVIAAAVAVLPLLALHLRTRTARSPSSRPPGTGSSGSSSCSRSWSCCPSSRTGAPGSTGTASSCSSSRSPPPRPARARARARAAAADRRQAVQDAEARQGDQAREARQEREAAAPQARARRRGIVRARGAGARARGRDDRLHDHRRVAPGRRRADGRARRRRHARDVRRQPPARGSGDERALLNERERGTGSAGSACSKLRSAPGPSVYGRNHVRESRRRRMFDAALGARARRLPGCSTAAAAAICERRVRDDAPADGAGRRCCLSAQRTFTAADGAAALEPLPALGAKGVWPEERRRGRLWCSARLSGARLGQWAGLEHGQDCEHETDGDVARRRQRRPWSTGLVLLSLFWPFAWRSATSDAVVASTTFTPAVGLVRWGVQRGRWLVGRARRRWRPRDHLCAS